MMPEPVRDTVVRSIKEAGQPKRPLVGLAQNVKGVPFQCGTCEYFDKGTCRNKDPELDGRKVGSEWCCDLYDHEGMRVIVE